MKKYLRLSAIESANQLFENCVISLKGVSVKRYISVIKRIIFIV